MIETIYIYALYSTRDSKEIRYVGKTVTELRFRLGKHKSDSKRNDTYKDRWIRKELSLGHKIKIEVIDEVHTSDWEFWEKFYISQYGEVFKLTNAQPGGLSSGTEKRVVVLDSFGNKLHTSSSIAQSARNYSVAVSRVENILSTKHYAKSIKGFQFIFESEYDPSKDYDINTYYYKYNRRFELIGKYIRKTLKDKENITSSISNKTHYKGFIWAYSELTVDQLRKYKLKRSKLSIVKENKINAIKGALMTSIRVIQYDLDGNLIKEYKSKSGAGREIGSVSGFYKAMKRDPCIYKESIWRVID